LPICEHAVPSDAFQEQSNPVKADKTKIAFCVDTVIASTERQSANNLSRGVFPDHAANDLSRTAAAVERLPAIGCDAG
jgi:hypothetical protein